MLLACARSQRYPVWVHDHPVPVLLRWGQPVCGIINRYSVIHFQNKLSFRRLILMTAARPTSTGSDVPDHLRPPNLLT